MSVATVRNRIWTVIGSGLSQYSQGENSQVLLFSNMLLAHLTKAARSGQGAHPFETSA